MDLAPLPFLKYTLVPRLLSRIKINNMKKIENVGKVHTQIAHPPYIDETIMETGFPLIMADIVAKQYKITSITLIEVDSVQGFLFFPLGQYYFQRYYVYLISLDSSCFS